MQLKDKGTIFACNAFYRDFTPKYELPDYLVAIDDPIITEIECSDFPSSKFIVPPIHEQFEPRECSPHRARSNAGMNAMLEAIKKDHRILYCFGFDFLLADERSLSNLYDGTNAYEACTRANESDTINRVNYFEWMANKFDHVRFIFVYPDTDSLSVRRVNSANVSGMLYSRFLKEIT